MEEAGGRRTMADSFISAMYGFFDSTRMELSQDEEEEGDSDDPTWAGTLRIGV